MASRRSRTWSPAIVVLAFALLGATLSACGSTGVSGAGTSTSLSSPTTTSTVPPEVVTLAAVRSIAHQRTKTFIAKARIFHKCDHATWDSQGPAPCLAKAKAEAAAADAFLGDLQALGSPAAYDITIKDLKAMRSAGTKVASACAGGDDQPCDQALARFRADEQTILWDLNASL